MICKSCISFLLTLALLLLSGCGTYESSPLIVSIRSDDAYSVKSLIESGEDVNALSFDLIDRQYWKITPLIRASITGNLEVIQMLLKAGADVNGRDEWGDTSLMATAEFGHIEACKLLINYGADVNATKPNKTTALMIAARRGYFEITKLLIKSGADVNIGSGGDTALSLATWKGHAEIIKILVENDAIVSNKKNKIKVTQSEKNGNLLPVIKTDQPLVEEKKEITYIKIGENDKIYKDDIFYTVNIGDILEVLQKKPCGFTDQECWEVINVLTGKSGDISVDQVRSHHHMYIRKGRYPFQDR